MKSSFLFLAFGVATFLVCGCAVPTVEYERLREKYDKLELECENLRSENLKLARNNEILAAKLAGREAQLSAAQSIIEALKKEQEEKPPTAGETKILPSEWKTNPETGGIVLEDEILFAPGKAELSAKGKEMVSKLAKILNSEKYKGYLVRVDGHTDDTPVVKTKEENIDNWFLSARRAHSVLTVLLKEGVAPERLYLSGFGEIRPIEPNAPNKKGNPKNRRVEILLMKPPQK
ncbi:MAG: OmpA family protein [Planctomycetota bacterium]|nr:OmpA family protein [Planctomycetota bacterium]